MFDPVTLSSTNQKMMILGNQAIALGLIDGDIDYVASYPGTPSTEIMEYLIENPGPYHAGWATNEAVAMEESIAAMINGRDAAFICKSVGLNVAMDPLMTIVNSGSYGALVIIVADDPGMHSSQNEQDSKLLGKFGKIPVFNPSDAQEAYFYAREAIKLSRSYRIPVMIRSTTRLSHSLKSIQREPPVQLPELPFQHDIQRYVSIPGNARKNHHNIIQVHESLQEDADELHYWSELYIGKSYDHLIITSGNEANYVIEAVQNDEIPSAIFVPKMVYPLPEKKILSLLEKYSNVLIIEELEPFLEDQIRIIASKYRLDNTIIGKGTLSSLEGELSIELVQDTLREVFDIEVESSSIELPMIDDLMRVRPPVLCAGCPHRSTYVEIAESLKRFDPVFHNDIGCYSLGVMPPHRTAQTLICMGASIPMATATSITNPEKLSVAIIGDSTFWHSGLSGLANAIWKEANVLVVVVDNSYTAMTGGQPNPSSHEDRLNIGKVAEAMGADVYYMNPMDYDVSRKLVKEVGKKEGVRVIVSQYPCALRKDTQNKEQMKTTMIVDPELCTGCTLCVTKLGCPAITMDGELGNIDPALCNSCGYCEQICRFDAIRRIE